MDKVEARAILKQQLESYRKRTYGELVESVGSNSAFEIRGPSGADYQIEIDIMWDSLRDRTNVLVMGAIDDGRFPSAFSPLCDSFIVGPDGRFIGE